VTLLNWHLLHLLRHLMHLLHLLSRHLCMNNMHLRRYLLCDHLLWHHRWMSMSHLMRASWRMYVLNLLGLRMVYQLLHMLLRNCLWMDIGLHLLHLLLHLLDLLLLDLLLDLLDLLLLLNRQAHLLRLSDLCLLLATVCFDGLTRRRSS